MPDVHRIKVDGPSGKETAVIWNVEAPVGVPHGTNHRMDAMLVQFLLFDAGFCDLADIDGSWHKRSQSFLKTFDAAFSGPTTTPLNSRGISQDGIVDRMRPGQISGSISHLEYKVNLLNRLYVKKRKKTSTSPSGPGQDSCRIGVCSRSPASVSENRDDPPLTRVPPAP